MTTLLFTIDISAEYRGMKEIYSAQVIARNGMKLYHLAEAVSISEALEKVVQEMRPRKRPAHRSDNESTAPFLALSNRGRVRRSDLPTALCAGCSD